jgi:hypothetical protein
MARAHLEHQGGDVAMRWDERGAVEAIDRAIRDIRLAAIDDGKNLGDHPPVDTREPWAGRIRKALVDLRAARSDIGSEEDNAFASSLRARGLKNVDLAIQFTEQGIAEAESPRAPAPVVLAQGPMIGPPPAVASRSVIGPSPAEAHPAYLHALSDLRLARSLLERRGGDRAMKWDERAAIASIDRAIGDIRQAAIDDAKNPQDHPAVDAREPRAGRLHRALAALRAAREDIGKEEDNAFANGLRARGLRNIDDAIQFTARGVAEAETAI